LTKNRIETIPFESDHLALLFDINIKKTDIDTWPLSEQNKYNFQKADWNKFADFLHNYDNRDTSG